MIGTDEDFAPYRTGEFRITSGENAGVYESSIVSGGAAPAILEDLTLNGPTVYGGYGCPDSAPVPTPESIPGYLDSLQPGEENILVLQRGPSGDPSAPEEACFPGEKAHEAALAGWDAVVFVNRHIEPDDAFCGSGAFVDEIVAVCTTHEAFHLMFNTAVSTTYPEQNRPSVTSASASRSARSSTAGATSTCSPAGRQHPHRRRHVRHSRGARPGVRVRLRRPLGARGGDRPARSEPGVPVVLQRRAPGCADPCTTRPTPNCELVEVGGYLDPEGQQLLGRRDVRPQRRTIILASDRDSGLWIFRDP